MCSESVKQVFICIACAIFPNIAGILYGLDLSLRKNYDFEDKSLNRPSGDPPGYIVGPVWVYLYTTMGIAHYLVYRSGGGWLNKVTKWPTIAYVIQLLVVIKSFSF